MTDQERITLELTREQADIVQRWAVRNIRVLNGWPGLSQHEKKMLTEYREIDAAVNDAIAAQLRAQDAGEGE